MNYTELVQAIKDYTENEETTFVSQIPTFVKQAEQRIYRAVTIPELKKNVTGTLSSGDKYLARPTDFLTVLSLAVVDGSGDYSYLLDKDVNFIREAFPSTSTQGLPLFYGQFDGDAFSGSSETSSGNFILGPTPDANYAIELHYYYDPPSIVTSGASWLGDNADTTLLYGSLVEAYTFMKGESDMLQLYASRYKEALGELSVVDVKSKRDIYRDGEIRPQ
jgi:hypothetical protein|tara:strand:- start:358 stop:1017 length:660 start_codon:yes stop_codon:yes gene_type:complete